MAHVTGGDRATVVRSEIVEARAEAARLLDEARKRAAALVEEQRDRLRAEARAAALLEAEAARRMALTQVTDDLAELVVGVARRLIGEALETRPELVRARVIDALERVRRASMVRVHLHPADVPALEGVEAEVVPDETLSRGDCVVRSELGEIDARIEVGLDGIRRALGAAIR